MATNIVTNMSQTKYRVAEGVAMSDLKRLKRSPAFAALGDDTPTKAKEFGTAVHTAILEPTKLRTRYALEPEQPEDFTGKVWRLTKPYKEAKAKIEAAGQFMLKAEEWEAFPMISDNIAEAGFDRFMPTDEDMVEVSIFTDDTELGIRRKIRPDALLREQRTIIDVKTTRDHRAGPFARQCVQLGYHMGAAYYLDTAQMAGLDIENYLFLAINNTYPFEVGAYVLDVDSMEQGRSEYLKLLSEWARREETEDWPATTGKIEEIRIPEYAITFVEENSW